MLDPKRLKDLKLILFDVDGTLVTDNNVIPNETIELVGKLQELGVRFTFATGRLHSAIIDHAETLHIKTPLISLDGSMIKSHPNGEVIFESFLKKKHVLKAIKQSEIHVLYMALCLGDAIYYTEHQEPITKMLEKYGAKFMETDTYTELADKTLEAVIVGDYRDSMREVRKMFTFPHSWGLDISYYKSSKHKDMYYLEIRKGGCSKGTGLKRLTKHLGIKISQTAVIGDWFNDRSLFQTKAVKVAVNNAVAEIKSMADMVTKKDNNEAGPAEFLEMVYKAKKG